MSYRSSKALAAAGVALVLAPAYGVLAFAPSGKFGAPALVALAGAAFALAHLLGAAWFRLADAVIRRDRFARRETRFLEAFSDRLRMSFSMQDLIESFRQAFELPADAAAVVVRGTEWEILYQSPAAVSSSPESLVTLERNYRDRGEGLWYLDGELGLLSGPKGSRGILVSERGYKFFLLSRLAPFFEPESVEEFRVELRACLDRAAVIERLFGIASLSREWELVAQTQRSFLPATMPERDKFTIVPYFRPLVNVSGDYYDAIAVDEHRTLLVLGDVSGKGLAAALVMGIVVNAIRDAPDPADLPALVRLVHEAIQDMHFDDKYTVLFLGLLDTRSRTLRYVNASMPEAYVVSRGVMGPVLKRLGSTMGLVGILPIDAVPVEEVEIRSGDTVLISSDGLTEVANEDGAQLGDSEGFEALLKRSLAMPSEELVERLAALVQDWVGSRHLRDDVTMLAVKAGNLWS
ncbi:MAG: SpoIIE family protein phosphatase [Spirochaetales bacterium]|nr:SpoIIE family protein phosphatase [Spirochaetales bacterium]